MKEGKRGNKKQQFFVIIVGFFLTVLICSAPSWWCRVFCYDSTLAHPNIVQLAALLYNKNNPDKKLTLEEINWIMLGARDEDTPTRWLNHFYDPAHNAGLMFEKQHLSAKAWAVNSLEQTNYALGDKSWPRAIADFNKGDREDAFKELGYVLHLIADMSVPAHTRADVHVLPGDSYETYVKSNWNNIQKNISSKFIEVSSLSQAFDSLANYSNNNFYSDDTVGSKNFSLPAVGDIFKNKTNDGVEYYRLNKNNDKNILIGLSFVKSDGQNQINEVLNVNNTYNLPINNFILSDYSTHLIPKAIGTTAGVIKLFFSEAEKTVQADLPKNRTSLLGWGNTVLGWGISALGDAKNYLTEKFGGNNQAVGQGAATVVPVNQTPPLNLPLKEGETVVVLATPVSNVKKVLGEKIVVPVIVAPPLTPPLAPPPTQGGQARGGDSVPVTPPVVQNNGGGGGSYASAPVTETKILNQVQDDNTYTPTTTATSTTEADTTTTTTPPLAPPQGGGDTATTTIPTSTIPFTDTPTSTASTSTPGADPCASAEASCDTQSAPPLDDSTTTTPATDTTATTTPPLTPPQGGGDTATTTTATSTPPDLAPSVVINEVAWAGTAGISARHIADKWFELYNNTDQVVDMSGWKLYIGDVAIYTVKISTTTIAARGYYLFERSPGLSWNRFSSDDTVSDIPGDYIFYLDSNSKITGERLRLVDAVGEIVDEVDCSDGWFTNNDDGKYRTMEKIDPRQSGNDPNNWHASHGPRPLGRGRDGVTIYGSPRQPNVGNIVLAGVQQEETRTLTTADNPYIADFYSVPAGKTLIIEPGVVLKTRYSTSPLRVAGRLEIKGTATSSVVITSGRDQTFTDPNLNTIFGTWTAEPAQPRDWQGLWFDPGSVAEISGLDLRYAGYKFKSPYEDHWFGSVVEQSIRADHATLNISDSQITNNGNVALYLENSTSTIKNTNFDSGSIAVSVLDSVITLENVRMSNFSNTNGPLDVVRSFPGLKNLQLENNQFNGVHLENPTFQGDTTLGKEMVWSMSYPVIPAGATLRLDPGAKILLPHQGIIEINGGNLLAKGTSDEPVEFAPFIPTDTWGGLRFTNSDSVLENVRLTRGNNMKNNNEGIITAYNSRLQLKNVLMDQLRGEYNIVKSKDSQLDLDTVNLGYDTKPGIETCAIDIQNGTLKLRSVSFKNLNYGLFALLSSLPDLDMNPLDLLDKFENVDMPMLPAYPWIKVPPPLP